MRVFPKVVEFLAVRVFPERVLMHHCLEISYCSRLLIWTLDAFAFHLRDKILCFRVLILFSEFCCFFGFLFVCLFDFEFVFLDCFVIWWGFSCCYVFVWFFFFLNYIFSEYLDFIFLLFSLLLQSGNIALQVSTHPGNLLLKIIKQTTHINILAY